MSCPVGFGGGGGSGSTAGTCPVMGGAAPPAGGATTANLHAIGVLGDAFRALLPSCAAADEHLVDCRNRVRAPPKEAEHPFAAAAADSGSPLAVSRQVATASQLQRGFWVLQARAGVEIGPVRTFPHFSMCLLSLLSFRPLQSSSPISVFSPLSHAHGESFVPDCIDFVRLLTCGFCPGWPLR